MTSGASRLSLMRPVSRGWEPRSSITVTCRRSNPQSDFWLRQGRWILRLFLFVKLPCEVNNSKRFPHLYHDVLQLVVWVRYVGRRHDQQPPLVIELIQESSGCLYICFYLHCCKHTRSQLHPAFNPFIQNILYMYMQKIYEHDHADSRTHSAASPPQLRLNWQTRLAVPFSSYPPSQWYSHVAP